MRARMSLSERGLAMPDRPPPPLPSPSSNAANATNAPSPANAQSSVHHSRGSDHGSISTNSNSSITFSLPSPSASSPLNSPHRAFSSSTASTPTSTLRSRPPPPKGPPPRNSQHSISLTSASQFDESRDIVEEEDEGVEEEGEEYVDDEGSDDSVCMHSDSKDGRSTSFSQKDFDFTTSSPKAGRGAGKGAGAGAVAMAAARAASISVCTRPPPPPAHHHNQAHSMQLPSDAQTSPNADGSAKRWPAHGPPPPPPGARRGTMPVSPTGRAPLAGYRGGAGSDEDSDGTQAKVALDAIEYYLRQALASQDLQAINDLVQRATDANLTSDLVIQAQTFLSDKAAESRENEVATLKHYMKQSLEAKNLDAIRDVLRKVDPVAKQISTGPHRRLYADFFALINESKAIMQELEKEDAQTLTAYLRQATQLRSREGLQAALAKCNAARHGLIDPSVLDKAKSVLAQLDVQAMQKQFLQLAVKNRDLTALQDSISQATKHGLTPAECFELADAIRVMEEVQEEMQDENAAVAAAAKRQAEKEREKAERKAAKAEKEREKAEKAEKGGDKGKWYAVGHRKKDGTAGSGGVPSVPVLSLFGGPLSAVLASNPPRPDSSNRSLPYICTCCMSFLRAHALREPGLFRVAGNKEQIDALRIAFEQQFQNAHKAQQAADAAGEGEGDAAQRSQPSTPILNEVHDASGVFKLYFRLLPEPLIPFDLYDRFIKVGHNKGDDRVDQLKELVQLLPKDNFALLDALCEFLMEVSTYSNENKMTPDNLAIVFAPNLVRPRVETPSSMITDMPASIAVISQLIQHHPAIFKAEGSKQEGGAEQEQQQQQQEAEAAQ